MAVIGSETANCRWTALAVAYPILLAGGLGALVDQVGRTPGP
jgi:hypothetical protein